jgi:hypothetical protein
VAAQLVDVELNPFAGVFIPLLELGRFQGSTGGVTPATGTIEAGQETSTVLGGRLAIWASGVLGFEAAFAYAKSAVETTRMVEPVSPSSGGGDTLDGFVWASSARVASRFGRRNLVSFHLLGGLALVGRGGADREERADLGGVVGVGAQLGRSRLRLRLDVEDYLYTTSTLVTDEVFGTLDLDSKLQSDLMVTAGLSLRLR